MKLAQILKDQQFLHRIKDNNFPFSNDSNLFRFQIDVNDGCMLNMDKIHEMEGRKKRKPTSVAKDLQRQMLLMIDKYGSYKGEHGIDFSAIGHTTEYCHYITTSLELQKVELTGMTDDELKVFFINIYNALVYHANIVIAMGWLKLPSLDKGGTEYNAWGRIGYTINGQNYSLHDIEHGMLRGNRRAHKRKIKSVVTKHDPRAPYIVKFDPRIHFALLSGVRSCPPIMFFSPKTIDMELSLATEGFLQAEVGVDNLNKQIILPKVFYYYKQDFGKTDSEMLQWITDHMQGDHKMNFEIMVSHKCFIKYSEDDWNMRMGFGESASKGEQLESSELDIRESRDNLELNKPKRSSEIGSSND